MTRRGIDFLEDWVSKNVQAGAPPDDPLYASNLANRCIADAATAGLTLEEIRPDMGTLESYIADAMVPLDQPGKSGD